MLELDFGTSTANLPGTEIAGHLKITVQIHAWYDFLIIYILPENLIKTQVIELKSGMFQLKSSLIHWYSAMVLSLEQACESL